jgi:hypothetical protein
MTCLIVAIAFGVGWLLRHAYHRWLIREVDGSIAGPEDKP